MDVGRIGPRRRGRMDLSLDAGQGQAGQRRGEAASDRDRRIAARPRTRQRSGDRDALRAKARAAVRPPEGQQAVELAEVQLDVVPRQERAVEVPDAHAQAGASVAQGGLAVGDRDAGQAAGARAPLPRGLGLLASLAQLVEDRLNVVVGAAAPHVGDDAVNRDDAPPEQRRPVRNAHAANPHQWRGCPPRVAGTGLTDLDVAKRQANEPRAHPTDLDRKPQSILELRHRDAARDGAPGEGEHRDRDQDDDHGQGQAPVTSHPGARRRQIQAAVSGAERGHGANLAGPRGNRCPGSGLSEAAGQAASTPTASSSCASSSVSLRRAWCRRDITVPTGHLAERAIC